MIKTFDAIVIGAGQAGPSLAGRLTGAGMSVALIERKLIGGTCVNTGVRPRKRSSPVHMPLTWHGAPRTMA
jgi:pyruvate/2-oxoglutarate dehydrogenase complex dihydrolipoamide dehydrogenase (E3) component